MRKTLHLSIDWLAKAVNKIFIGCLIVLLGVTSAITSPSPALAAAPDRYVDMVFVVDESGSMSGEHHWLKDAVVDLEASLKDAGIGTGSEINRYGLVGFANGGQRNRHLVGGADFGNSNQMVQALTTLKRSGATEDGYAAIDEALKYPFRPQAIVNIVLVTDEDRDVVESSLKYQTISKNLSDHHALLNAVVNIGLKDGQNRTALGVNGRQKAYIADSSGGFF